MCKASIVADDWVVKGCHIHIDGVELGVAPNHLGGITFKPIFQANTDGKKRRLREALRTAYDVCLADEKVRDQWIRGLRQGILFLQSYIGEPSHLANGRQLEFKFLILALERYSNGG